VQIKENFYTAESPTTADVQFEKFDVQEEIMNFPLIPYAGRVFVVEEKVESVRGIYVPPSARVDGEMQTNIGWVVAVGEGVDFCSPGDRVFYGRYAGSWVLDMKYRVMNEKDIFGRYK
jgi:co-chaperonin GroES (HSP10)